MGYGLVGVTVAAALYIWQSGSWPAIKVRLLGKLLPRPWLSRLGAEGLGTAVLGILTLGTMPYLLSA